MRRFQALGLVFLGTSLLILCTTSTIGRAAGTPPKGLPPWFEALDKNRDGQISLREWLAGGKKLEDFRRYDRNDDGFITPEEVLGPVKNRSVLNLVKGRVSYEGNIEEAANETYRGKKSFKIFAIRLERGRTYQIEQVSQVYFAYLYLEGPDGKILDSNNSGGNGRTARIVHRAAETGTYRIIATNAGGFRTGAFSLSIGVLPGAGGGVVKGLPPWFRELDKDEDGQISLREWRQGGKEGEAFHEYDLNEDGFITAEEALRVTRSRARLKLEQGRGKYDGALEPTDDEKYRGLKYSKILTVELKAGTTYQIDHTSKAFKPLVALEDPDGKVAAFRNNEGRGTSARVVYQAAKTGTYRVIATSMGGGQPGAFSISVRALDGTGRTLPKGLPPWFEALDTNHDGEISLAEWLKGGRTLKDFRKFDLNDDGLITAEEVLRQENKRNHLKLVKGQASLTGAIEGATGEKYRSKKLAKILTVRLEAGKTYQIDHRSRAFDAYLYLEGPDGAVLARDDDGGGNLNARIVHRAAEAGTYRIIATSLSGNGTGEFSVTVRVLDGSGGGTD